MFQRVTFLLFLAIATQSVTLHAMYRNQRLAWEHRVRNVNLAAAIACFGYSFYTIASTSNPEKLPEDAWCDTIRALGVGASGCCLLINTIISDREIFELRSRRPSEAG